MNSERTFNLRGKAEQYNVNQFLFDRSLHERRLSEEINQMELVQH
jgi:hypothetical protein